MLNTNMAMKISADDICTVKRTKNLAFQQFFNIIMNTSHWSEKSFQQKL